MDFFLSAASCYRSEQMINVGVKIFFFFLPCCGQQKQSLDITLIYSKKRFFLSWKNVHVYAHCSLKIARQLLGV